jgi:hypothetical protein
MFIGHFAVGFASKKFAPRASLGPLVAAPVFADILWPVFILLNWENARVNPGNTAYTPLAFVSYPWSHSLLMDVVWATVFAAIYQLISRYWAGTIAIWIGVVSHWVLDWISHRPDMPLYPGGPKVGLGLWNSVPGTMAVEFAMFAVGVWLYISTTRARDRIGTYGFGTYVGLLLLIDVGNRLSPPPPSVRAIAWVGIVAVAILIPWAWWFDHHRELRRS